MPLQGEESITITETPLTSTDEQQTLEVSSIQLEQSVIMTTPLSSEESISISTMPLPDEQSITITETPLSIHDQQTLEVSIREIPLEEFSSEQQSIEIISMPLPIEVHNKCTQTDFVLTEEPSECHEDIEALKSQVNSLKSEIIVVNQEKTSIMEMYTTAVTEYEINSTKCIQEYEVKLAQIRINNEKSEKKCHDLVQELEAFRMKLLSSENSNDRSLIKLRTEMEKKFANEKGKLESRFLSERKSLIDEYEERLRISRTENKELMSTNTSTVTDYEMKIKNIQQDYDIKLGALKTKNSKLEQRLRDVQAENKRITASLNDAKNRFEREIAELKKEMQTKHKKENESMEAEFEEEKARIIEKSKINIAYYEETIVKQEDMWMEKIAKMTSEKNKLQDDCASYIQELALLQKKVISLEKHYEMSIKDLKEEMENSYEKSEDKMEMNFQIERTNLLGKYQQSVKENEIKMTTLQQEYEVKIAQLTLENERNIQGLSNAVKDWETKFSKSTFDNENRIKELESKIKDLESKAKATISDYETQLTQCKNIHETSVTAMRREISDLEQKDNDNKEEISNLKEKMTDDEEQHKILIAQLNAEKKNELERLKALFNIEKKNMESRQEDLLSSYETKLESRKRELDEVVNKYEREVANLQKELSEAETEVRRLEDKVAEVEKHYKTLVQESKNKLIKALESKEGKLEDFFENEKKEIQKIHEKELSENVKEKETLVHYYETRLQQMEGEWEERSLRKEKENKDMKSAVNEMEINHKREIEMTNEKHRKELKEWELKLKDAEKQSYTIENQLRKENDELNEAQIKTVHQYELKISNIIHKYENRLTEVENEHERNDEINRKKIKDIRKEMSSAEETCEAETKRFKKERERHLCEKEDMENNFAKEKQRMGEARQREVQEHERRLKQLKDESDAEIARLEEESKKLKRRTRELELEMSERCETMRQEYDRKIAEIKKAFAKEKENYMSKYDQSVRSSEDNLQKITECYEEKQEDAEEEIGDLQLSFNKELQKRKSLEKELIEHRNEVIKIRETFRTLEIDYTKRLEEMSRFLKKEIEIIKMAYETEKAQLLKFLDDERIRHQETRKYSQTLVIKNEELEVKMNAHKVEIRNESERMNSDLLSAQNAKDDLQRESDILKKELGSLRMQLELSKKELASLQIKIKTSENKTNEVLDLEMENSKLLGEINSLYTQKEDLIKSLNRQERNVEEQRKQVTELERKNLALQESKTSIHDIECRYKMEFDLLTKHAEEQSKDLERIKDSNKNLQRELTQIRSNKSQDLEEEVLRLKNELHEIRNENCSNRKKIKDKMFHKERELRELSEEVEKAKKEFKLEQEHQRCEIEKARSKRIESSNTIKGVIENTATKETIKQLQFEITTLRKENDAFESKIVDIQRHYEHHCELENTKVMKEEIEKLESHYENERREIERLHLEEKDNINMAWVRKHEEQKLSWENQFKKTQNQIELLMREKYEANSKIKELQHKLNIEEETFKCKLAETKQGLLDEFETQLEELRQQKEMECQLLLSEERKQIEKQITVYKVEIAKLKESQSTNKFQRELTLRETNLKEQIYTLQEDNKDHQSRIFELERQLRTERDTFENKLEHMSEDYERDNEEMRKKLEHEREMVVISRDALQRELDKTKTELASLETQREEKSQRYIEKSEHQKRLEDIRSRLEMKYREHLFLERKANETSLSSCRSEISRLTQSKTNLETDYREMIITCEKLQEEIAALKGELEQIQRSRSEQHNQIELGSCGCAHYVYPTRDKLVDVTQYAENQSRSQYVYALERKAEDKESHKVGTRKKDLRHGGPENNPYEYSTIGQREKAKEHDNTESVPQKRSFNVYSLQEDDKKCDNTSIQSSTQHVYSSHESPRDIDYKYQRKNFTYHAREHSVGAFKDDTSGNNSHTHDIFRGKSVNEIKDDAYPYVRDSTYHSHLTGDTQDADETHERSDANYDVYKEHFRHYPLYQREEMKKDVTHDVTENQSRTNHAQEEQNPQQHHAYRTRAEIDKDATPDVTDIKSTSHYVRTEGPRQYLTYHARAERDKDVTHDDTDIQSSSHNVLTESPRQYLKYHTRVGEDKYVTHDVIDNQSSKYSAHAPQNSIEYKPSERQQVIKLSAARTQVKYLYTKQCIFIFPIPC